MKIISWNCCLNLSNKFNAVQSLGADILIIQECEKLPEDFFPGAKYFWSGHSDKKGIGVLLFGIDAEIDERNRPYTDEMLESMFPPGYKIMHSV